MKGKILAYLLFFFCISCKVFIKMAATEKADDKYSVLFKTFKTIVEDMKVQDGRLQTLENTATLNQSKIIADADEEFTEKQLNTIQDNIEQVKAHLDYISTGLAVEKNIRTENTNAIEKNTDNIAKVLKNVNATCVGLHETLTSQKDSEEDLTDDLETKLRHQEDKINSHTEKVVTDMVQNFRGALDEHEREQKEEIKKLVRVIENIQSNVDQMARIWLINHNLAKGKRAEQSSVFSGGQASAAIDGNSDGNWAHSSCTHTSNDLNPWWQVDLAGIYNIKRVVIKNRSDCCGERLHNLVISVSKDKGGNEEICGRFEGPSTNGATETIICSHQILGRYLKIQIMDGKSGHSYLTLCEVEVFSV